MCTNSSGLPPTSVELSTLSAVLHSTMISTHLPLGASQSSSTRAAPTNHVRFTFRNQVHHFGSLGQDVPVTNLLYAAFWEICSLRVETLLLPTFLFPTFSFFVNSEGAGATQACFPSVCEDLLRKGEDLCKEKESKFAAGIFVFVCVRSCFVLSMGKACTC